MTILIGSLCKLNVGLVWLVYGHVATWSESGSAGEGLVRASGEGVGVKNLVVGQIVFYVFCCCVVRMDGFV